MKPLLNHGTNHILLLHYVIEHMYYHHHSFPDNDYSLVETSK